MRRFALAAQLAIIVGAAPPAFAKPAEEYEITKNYETSQRASDGLSSSSTSGHDTLVERVIGTRDGGLELEYDLSGDVEPKDRARNWRFPARVYRPPSGPMQLLNRPELEARVAAWLKAGGLTRDDCGRLIFTWNAFRIECDPESVIRTIEAFDLRSADLREAAPYEVAEARGPGALLRTAAGPEGATFVVEMEVDPDEVRRTRAEADVAVGELMRKPMSLDAALLKRSKEQITGTIKVTFETDSTGKLRRRTKLTKVETIHPDGRTESDVAEETVERRPVSALAVQRSASAGP